MELPEAITHYFTQQRQNMVDLLAQLVQIESPTDDPVSQAGIQIVLLEALTNLGYEVEQIPGRVSGGQLCAQPRHLPAGKPQQLLIGHTDTVWPIGTLKEMPLSVQPKVVAGPGALDMKSGLTQMIFALRALQALGLETAVTPIVFLNSDEEIGSPDSAPHLYRLARQVNRALVLEPALGSEGKLKTARKGVGRFEVHVVGKAAHAGIEPEKGASATLELARIIHKLYAWHEPARGVTINVGLIEGGVQSNVVAPEARALIDMRVSTKEDAQRLEENIRRLEPEVAGTEIHVMGSFGRLPMERTPRNRLLWQQAQTVGQKLGLKLQEGAVGGGSDGNLTSLYTATLDGLGPIGGGAHAPHEFMLIDSMLERAALLTLLLLEPETETAAA